MDWARIKEGLVQNIIVGVLAAVASWYSATSQMTTVAADVADIKKSVASLTTDSSTHDKFEACARMRLFALERRVAPPPDCEEVKR